MWIVRMLFWFVLVVYGLLIGITLAYADQTITVNFTTGTLRLVDSAGVEQFSTQVVLPGGSYYALPASGVVTSARMGPTWTPTANTRAAHPGRYKTSYGPYEKGNAMGHCKVVIAFAGNQPILNTVRIHGNAKTADLGGRHSRGCVRIPDDVCGELIGLIRATPDQTQIHFTE